MRLSIDTRMAAELAQAFARAPAEVTKELTAATWAASLLIQREASERAPRGIGAGGGLAGSIQARTPAERGGAILGAVGSPLIYAAAVELGTKPHMPPEAPIADWVHHALGLRGKEAKKAVGGIRWKIKRHGTKPRRFMADTVTATTAQIESAFGAALARLLGRIGA